MALAMMRILEALLSRFGTRCLGFGNRTEPVSVQRWLNHNYRLQRDSQRELLHALNQKAAEMVYGKGSVTQPTAMAYVWQIHRFKPSSWVTWATAPILVHTRREFLSAFPLSDFGWTFPARSKPLKPNESRRLTSDAVDSLLVLLHNLNGIEFSCSLRNASTAPGVGVDPTWRVPETSISTPVICGRVLWAEDEIMICMFRRNLEICRVILFERIPKSVYVMNFQDTKDKKVKLWRKACRICPRSSCIMHHPGAADQAE